MLSRFLAAVAAMVVVVAASNILVLYPFRFYDGPRNARRVVLVGFLVGLMVSFYLSFNPLPWNVGGAPATTQRIALASAAAFVTGQLLDISIFSRLRAARAWFLPPLVASLFGSMLDTTIFFTVAFAPALAGIDGVFGLEDGSLGFPAPFLGIGPEVPLWTSLAAGDFMVKFLAAMVLLAPYRALMGRLKPLPPLGSRTLA
jgi:uncharacterized integral membrane protein (TIGR00697 family)